MTTGTSIKWYTTIFPPMTRTDIEYALYGSDSDEKPAPTTSVTAAAVMNNEKEKRVSKKRDYLRVTSLTLAFVVIATGATIRIPCIHTTIALGKTIGNLVIGTRGYCFTVPGTPEKCTSDPLGQLLPNHPI